MSAMKAVWTWLDGHKSAIGLTVALVLAWAEQQGYVPQHVYSLALSVLTAWGVVAVGDNVRKATRG